jgi:hypothetical protein
VSEPLRLPLAYLSNTHHGVSSADDAMLTPSQSLCEEGHRDWQTDSEPEEGVPVAAYSLLASGWGPRHIRVVTVTLSGPASESEANTGSLRA